MAIGSYFAFIIIVMGTTSADHMSAEEREQFNQDILAAHNLLRKYHNVPILQLDQEICDLIKVHIDRLEANEEPEIPTDYETNIITVRFDDELILDARMIVSYWYRKAQGYDYSIEPEFPSWETDSFTQLVWKMTTHIGVGLWIKNNKCCVIVAYSPPGNRKQEYIENVLRPTYTIDTDD